MKLAIIGGNGLIGSTTAFLAAQKGMFEEIKIIGRRKNMLKSHAMDMEHALMPFSKTTVNAADYEDIHDCEVIFITAGAPEREVVSRIEYLKDNIKIVDEIADNINKYNKNGIILIATNPVDVFNYYLYKKLNRDKSKMLGFSANDSLRLRWALSKELNLEFDEISGYCIGEHGEGQVPLMSLVKYQGNLLSIDDEVRMKIKNKLINWFLEFQNLNSRRTSGWTSSVMATEILEAIACDSGKVIECSVILDGELGYSDVSIGMPVSIGKNGIKKIMEPILSKNEQIDLELAVKKIKRQINIIY